MLFSRYLLLSLAGGGGGEAAKHDIGHSLPSTAEIPKGGTLYIYCVYTPSWYGQEQLYLVRGGVFNVLQIEGTFKIKKWYKKYVQKFDFKRSLLQSAKRS